MSHLRPEDRPSKLLRAKCRRGRHSYGLAQHIGGGISRQVCDVCNEVTIDLTGSDGAEVEAGGAEQADSVASTAPDA